MKKGLLVFVLAAYAPSLFAQGTPQTFPQNKRAQVYYYFSLARLLDEQGRLNEAIDQYKKALELDPNNSALYSEMADTYSRSGRSSDAEKAADKAVQFDADNLAAHKLLFTIYTGILNDRNNRATDAEVQRSVQRAISECEEIIRIDPTQSQYYLMLGRFYQFQNKPDKEAEVYKKLLGMEPGSEEGVMALAELHLNAGNGIEAARLLETFLKANPEADSAWHTLGDAYTASHDSVKAADAYKHAVDLNPADAEHLQAYAEALFAAERFDDAAKVYQQLARDNADDGNAAAAALLRLGQIYRRQAKYDQARSSLEKAIALAPENLELQFNLALVDRDDGRLEEALKRLTSLVDKTAPRNGKPTPAESQSRGIFLTYVAILNSTLGHYDEAIRRFTELRTISPEKDKVDSYIVDTYRTARNLDKALEYSETALVATPNSRELQVAHADIIAEKGKIDEGVKALDKLIKNTDDDIDILSAIVNIYERAHKFGDAQKVLDTLMKRFPGDEHVYFLQGAIYSKQKKYNDAEKAFQKALDIDKDNSQVLNYLGYMLADNGTKLDNALTLIQRAVDQDPANGAYLDSLGWVYFKLNRLDLAEQYLKRAVRFVNFDSDIHDHLGELYFKTGRYEEALDSWTKSLQLATDSDDLDKLRKKVNDAKSKIAKK
jgi:tetratricopeptide (TPR) repeat protein